MLQKSYCCECQQEFTKGDIVTKYKSKTFWAGLPGFQSCLAPYANRHQLAKFWPKKRATEAANGMVYENRLDRYVTKAANRFIAASGQSSSMADHAVPKPPCPRRLCNRQRPT